jgi:homoaconitase
MPLARYLGSSFGRNARFLATATTFPQKDCTTITPPYEVLLAKLQTVREILSRPLTLAEKILYSHLDDPHKSLGGGGKIRGEA